MKEHQQDEHWKVLVLLLKEIAERKGITHQAIADKSGLTRSNVTRVFGLLYVPTLKTFLKMSIAIGVNIFFEDKEAKTDLNEAFNKAMEQLKKRTG